MKNGSTDRDTEHRTERPRAEPFHSMFGVRCSVFDVAIGPFSLSVFQLFSVSPFATLRAA